MIRGDIESPELWHQDLMRLGEETTLDVSIDPIGQNVIIQIISSDWDTCVNFMNFMDTDVQVIVSIISEHRGAWRSPLFPDWIYNVVFSRLPDRIGKVNALRKLRTNHDQVAPGPEGLKWRRILKNRLDGRFLVNIRSVGYTVGILYWLLLRLATNRVKSIIWSLITEPSCTHLLFL